MSKGKLLAFSVVAMALSSVAALVCGELLLQLFIRPATTYRALPPNLSVVFSIRSLPGVRSPSNYRTNSMGVRAREWSSDRRSEYRILVLGGSTTECLVTDQSRVWTTLLEEALGPVHGRRPWVGNIGRSGLSTSEHILQMRHLPEVYDPDLILILEGVNDFSSRLRRGDPYDPDFAERPENRVYLMERAFSTYPGSLPESVPEDRWYQRFRLWRLGRVLKRRFSPVNEAQDTAGSNLARWRAARAAGRRSDHLPSFAAPLDRYARNLHEIIALARGRNTPIILMTQPVLWRNGLSREEEASLWLGGVGDFRDTPGSLYYEPGALASGMDAYNNRMLEVCARQGIPCVDLAAVIPKTGEYFYDDCHFNDVTHPIIAQAVADAIAQVVR